MTQGSDACPSCGCSVHLHFINYPNTMTILEPVLSSPGGCYGHEGKCPCLGLSNVPVTIHERKPLRRRTT